MKSNIKLGLHLHENLSSSFGFVQFALCMKSEREFIIDGSLHGMGRIPGNLPSEMLMSYFNARLSGKDNYNVHCLAKIIQDIILPIKEERNWGYSPIYMYSAILGIDRTYPEYLVEKMGLDHETSFWIMDKVKERGLGSVFNEQEVNKMILENE